MKKTISLMLCLLVLFLAPVAALAETMYVKTESGTGVHLRTGPSTDYDIMETVPYGAAVEVVEMLYGSAWVNVAHNGNYGYMMMRYLSYDKPTPAPSPTKKPSGGGGGGSSSEEAMMKRVFSGFNESRYEAVVVPSTPSGFVNLRWAPTKSAPVRSQYWAGGILQVKARNSEWSEVYDPATDMHGFMMTYFLTPTNVGDGVGQGS